MNELIKVKNSENLCCDYLRVERIPIGICDDYKPCIGLLKNGELSVIAFHQYNIKDNMVREDIISFSSKDGGKVWTERKTLELTGREPYYSILEDGTIFVTTHLLENDIRNKEGFIHSYVHRSNNNGVDWETVKICSYELPNINRNDWTHTSRNIIRLKDGTIVFGVSVAREKDYLWMSRDNGKTWDRNLECIFHDINRNEIFWPFFAETFLWQAQSGDLIGIFRVDHNLFPIKGKTIADKDGDQYERMILFRSKDYGRNWYYDGELGSYYGEHYPSIIRIKNGQLMLTFTVRGLAESLGVHAVPGKEKPDGFEFDFKNYRIIIDEKTPTGYYQGGGFGPTVQLYDGTLVTVYSYRGIDNKTHMEVARWFLP